MFAPQMALRPEYDRQSIRQDHLYKSEHPNILTWIKWEGRGRGWVKGVAKRRSPTCAIRFACAIRCACNIPHSFSSDHTRQMFTDGPFVSDNL